jgi:DNA (cytosine-5)-methyltransferase 1
VPSSRGEHLVVGSLDTECGGGKLTHQTIANGHIIGEWQSPNGKDIVGAMRARDYKGIGNDDLTEGRGLAVAYAFEPGIAGREGNPSRFTEEVAGTLRRNMGDNQTAVAIGTDCYNGAITGDVAATMGTPGSSVNASGPTVMHAFRMQAFGEYADDQTASAMKARDYKDATDLVSVTTMKAVGTDMFNGVISGDVAVPMTARGDGTGTGPTVMQAMAVRRLTPIECERLQGFPDNYTQIPWSKKPADQCPDGVRYKALGNSMAVPVMRWIGERINKFK